MKAILLLSFVTVLSGQSFDVASVKTILSDNPQFRTESLTREPKAFYAYNALLGSLVQYAFNLSPYQIDIPSWMSDRSSLSRFDVMAKVEEPVTESRMREMLQSLLVERFELTSHYEERSIDVMVLRVMGVLKLKRVEGSGPGEIRHSRSKATNRLILDIKEMSMVEFIRQMSKSFGLMLVDKTGLEGLYNGSIGMDPSVVDLSEFFSSLKRDTGLGISKEQMIVKILVVDRCRRVPLPN